MDSLAREDIPIERRILKVLHGFKDREEKSRLPASAVLERMRQTSGRYDMRLLHTVTWFLSEGYLESGISPPVSVIVSELRPGYILVSNVETEDRRLLVTPGHELSGAIVERLMNYHQVHKIKEPIQVSKPAGYGSVPKTAG